MKPRILMECPKCNNKCKYGGTITKCFFCGTELQEEKKTVKI
jgi:hypothetical protein